MKYLSTDQTAHLRILVWSHTALFLAVRELHCPLISQYDSIFYRKADSVILSPDYAHAWVDLELYCPHTAYDKCWMGTGYWSIFKFLQIININWKIYVLRSICNYGETCCLRVSSKKCWSRIHQTFLSSRKDLSSSHVFIKPSYNLSIPTEMCMILQML